MWTFFPESFLTPPDLYSDQLVATFIMPGSAEGIATGKITIFSKIRCDAWSEIGASHTVGVVLVKVRITSRANDPGSKLLFPLFPVALNVPRTRDNKEYPRALVVL